MKFGKKYGIITIMILAAVFSVFLPIYIWPKDVSNEFDAVVYEYGNSANYTTVSVDIDGHFNRRLFGGTRFMGKIKFGDSDIPEEFYSQSISIKFGTDGIGVLKYFDESSDKLRLVEKGYIHMPMDLSYVVISWSEEESVEDIEVTESTVITGPVADIGSAESLVGEKFSKLLR